MESQRSQQNPKQVQYYQQALDAGKINFSQIKACFFASSGRYRVVIYTMEQDRNTVTLMGKDHLIMVILTIALQINMKKKIEIEFFL
jgi:hypothetical protein